MPERHRQVEVSFLVRIWHEEDSDTTWRGYVQEVEGRSGTHFTTLTDLVAFILEHLTALEHMSEDRES